MGTEIEKKYLLKGTLTHQGYLSLEDGATFAKTIELSYEFNPTEARLRKSGERYLFTFKGKGGTVRNEQEVGLIGAGRELFDRYWPQTLGARVEKIRVSVPYGDNTLEIDFFTDRDNFILAEIETETEEEANALPAIGVDVSEDPAYKNRKLAK